MKICSKCNIEKDYSEFGRWKHCKTCLAKIQRERTIKERLTPEGKEKHNKWANEFYKRHRDKCVLYMRKRRKTKDYKEKMHSYRKQKKDIIYNQEVITKKRYHEKNRDTISDRYIVHLLSTQGYGKPEHLIKEKELLETYRIHIQLKRLIYATNLNK